MIDVKVCVGTSCHLKGSYNVLAAFQTIVEDKQLHDKVELQVAFSMGKFGQGVCVAVKDDIDSLVYVNPATTLVEFLHDIPLSTAPPLTYSSFYRTSCCSEH